MALVVQTNETRELARARKAPAMMTLDEMALEMQVSYQTAYRLAREGKIPGVQKVGGQYRGHRSTFHDWLKNPQNGSTQ